MSAAHGRISDAASKVVESIQPLVPVPWVLRLDLVPFLVLYLTAAAVWQVHPDEMFQFVGYISLPVIGLLHALFFLLQYWFPGFLVFIGWRKTAFESCTHLIVRPLPNSGTARIVPVHAGPFKIMPLPRTESPLEAFNIRRASSDCMPTAEKIKAACMAAPEPLDVARGALPTKGREYLWFDFQQVRFVMARRSTGSSNGSAEAVPGEAFQFYPIGFPGGRPLAWYCSQSGVKGRQAATPRRARYGRNELPMPAPTFVAMFQEHALSPFFVFQIFCVVLWMLDDYWYVSLTTLGMLVMMESIAVVQRIGNHNQLRSMRPSPGTCLVYREGEWQRASSAALLPGDIVAVGRGIVPPVATEGVANGVFAADDDVSMEREEEEAQAKRRREAMGTTKTGVLQRLWKLMSTSRPEADPLVIPADILLLRGGVVANEAMLTGESVPQRKEGCADAAMDAVRAAEEEKEAREEEGAAGAAGPGSDDFVDDLTNDGVPDLSKWVQHHARHVLFAGTKVVSHANATEPEAAIEDGEGAASAAGEADAATGVPVPPEGGAIGYVLRTGFSTAQGSLMRSILFSQGKVSSASWEGLAFIGFLLIFAIASSSFVLINTWEEEGRDKWKLVLHCVMIITSVVPPDLPVQLSMAVNASLASLATKQVFCVEPFRIPKAGLVDTCCFDKTGTLTRDQLLVQGFARAGGAQGGGSGGSKKAPAGASSFPPATKLIQKAASLDRDAILVLAGCHSLSDRQQQGDEDGNAKARKDPDIEDSDSEDEEEGSDPTRPSGDPLEEAAMQTIGWGVREYEDIGLTVAFPSAAAAKAAFQARASLRKREVKDKAGGGAAAANPGGSSGGAGGKGGAAKPAALGDSRDRVVVLRRWAFSSASRRMTTVVAMTKGAAGSDFGSAVAGGFGGKGAAAGGAAAAAASRPDPGAMGGLRVLVKGAPEAVRGLLGQVPKGYDEAARALAYAGYRVIALAWRGIDARDIPTGPGSKGRGAVAGGNWGRLQDVARRTKHLPRSMAEAGLISAGFLVLDSPLKADTSAVIKHLREASMRCIMITGDAALTAVAVSKKCGIVGVPKAPPSSFADLSLSTIDAAAASQSEASSVVWILEERERDTGSPSEGADGPAWARQSQWKVVSGGQTSAPTVESRDFSPDPATWGATTGTGAMGQEVVLCCTGAGLEPLLQAAREEMRAVKAAAAAKAERAGKSAAAISAAGDDVEAEDRGPASKTLAEIARRARVFARVSPPQKESIVAALNADGRHTLYCGDGTNDVGALKQAAVGISIVSDPDAEETLERVLQDRKELQQASMALKRGGIFGGNAETTTSVASIAQKLRQESSDIAENAQATRKKGAAGSKKGKKKGGKKAGAVDDSQDPMALARKIAAEKNPILQKKLAQDELQKAWKQMQSEMSGAMGGVRFGDASIAAPFTSKNPSIDVAGRLLRQGRGTLMTTQQMFRILGVISLVVSYQLSVLYMYGVKTGDWQGSIVSMATAGFFMSISFSTPLEKLAPQRPHKTVFHAALVSSVLFQFVVHVIALALVSQWCLPYIKMVPNGTYDARDEALRRNLTSSGDMDALGAGEAESAGLLSSLETGLDGEIEGDGMGLNLGLGGEAADFDLESDVDETASAQLFSKVAGASSGAASNGAQVGGLMGWLIDMSGEDAPDVNEDDFLSAYEKSPSLRKAAEAGKRGEVVEVEMDGHFVPNVMNTAMFLVSTAQQACTFAVNYSGRPFLPSLFEYRRMVFLTIGLLGGVIACATGMVPELNEYLQLVVLPTEELRTGVVTVVLVDVALCFGFEMWTRRALGHVRPPRSD